MIPGREVEVHFLSRPAPQPQINDNDQRGYGHQAIWPRIGVRNGPSLTRHLRRSFVAKNDCRDFRTAGKAVWFEEKKIWPMGSHFLTSTYATIDIPLANPITKGEPEFAGRAV